MVPFNITRAAHAELLVTNLERSWHFYVEVLGMLEISKNRDCLYLGGYEERDYYSLVLRKASHAGAGHLAFRVATDIGVQAIASRLTDQPSRGIISYTIEPAQGFAIRVQDPSGLPIEFYHHMFQRPWQRQEFHLHCGANIMRIDHFNVQVPDVQKAYDWWTSVLGFYCSEYTVTDPPEPEKLWAAWLHRKQNVHDIAIMNGKGPRLHHVGFWVKDEHSILRTCDILASRGMTDAIERGPGRHGLSNAFFLYLRDPDGNRIELFTNDYLIPDPDFEPVKWTLSDPRRATFWGHKPPISWFQEASYVENIHTGEFMPVAEPLLTGRPSFVT